MLKMAQVEIGGQIISLLTAKAPKLALDPSNSKSVIFQVWVPGSHSSTLARLCRVLFSPPIAKIVGGGVPGKYH